MYNNDMKWFTLELLWGCLTSFFFSWGNKSKKKQKRKPAGLVYTQISLQKY
jgi:hypothetical protein